MKYLLLAQPKSASTSLMFAIANAAGISFGQQFSLRAKPLRLRDRALKWGINSGLKAFRTPLSTGTKIDYSKTFRHAFPAVDYPALSCAHSDIADFAPNAVGKDTPCFKFDLHKQHFPPTPNNVRFFHQVKKIVLTRDVDESVNSYLRVPLKTTNTVFQWLLSNNEQFRKQLKSELLQWQDGWVSIAKGRDDVLVITYNELLAAPQETIERAVDFLGLDLLRNEIALPEKRKYR